MSESEIDKVFEAALERAPGTARMQRTRRRRKEERPHPPGTKIAMHMDEALDRVLRLALTCVDEHPTNASNQSEGEMDALALMLVTSLRDGLRSSKP